MHPMPNSGLPANRLRALRTEQRLTYMDVAIAVGKWPSTIVRWEKEIIPQHQLPVLADLLGVSVPYLAGWTEADSEPDSESESEVAA